MTAWDGLVPLKSKTLADGECCDHPVKIKFATTIPITAQVAILALRSVKIRRSSSSIQTFGDVTPR